MLASVSEYAQGIAEALHMGELEESLIATASKDLPPGVMLTLFIGGSLLGCIALSCACGCAFFWSTRRARKRIEARLRAEYDDRIQLISSSRAAGARSDDIDDDNAQLAGVSPAVREYPGIAPGPVY